MASFQTAASQALPPNLQEIPSNVRQEFSALKDYYLDAERREQLRGMNAFRRVILTAWYLLKSLYLKLNTTRRFLLLVGIGLTLFSGTFRVERQDVVFTNDTTVVGFMVLLFILMLELKDKLLAHDELKAGHAVQVALMPKRTPTVDGWDIWLLTRPANDVGGDLLDYLPMGGGRCSIALGDLAGKGLPAALFMGKLQATLRALRSYSSSLSDFLAKVNEVFYRDKIPNMFASLVYLEFERGGRTIDLVNAGHFLPMVLSGQNVREIPKSGPGLGIIASATFKEQKIEMQPSDLLLIYSDGLTEARNENGEFFGEQRLKAMLTGLSGCPCTEAGERILAAVAAFRGSTPLTDDLTLVLLRRENDK